MADLQQILGTMLATGMGGRSGRGADHIGSVLGGSGFGGSGFGSGGMGAPRAGGPGFKQAAGLAALGYLAYRAFQERQQNQQAHPTLQGTDGRTPQPSAGSPWGSAQGGSSGGGILGSIFGGFGGGSGGRGGTTGGGPSLGERLSGILQTRGAPQSAGAGAGADRDGAYPELAMEDQHALLLIRAMIAAANADGEISPEERSHVLSALDEAGAGPDERRVVEQELANPASLDSIVRAVGDEQTAEQVYMASLMAVAEMSDAERSYMQYLATRLKLDPQRVEQLHRAA